MIPNGLFLPGQTARSRARTVSARFSHYLYRYFDADGLLLYIGCSQEPTRRISAHAKSKARTSVLLQKYAVRVEVDADPLPNRDAGHDYEAVAIHGEQPLFNYHHRCLPAGFIDRQVEDYERGDIPRSWGTPINASRRILDARSA